MLIPTGDQRETKIYCDTSLGDFIRTDTGEITFWCCIDCCPTILLPALRI